MLPAAALREALAIVPRIAVPGPWYRLVNYDHLTIAPPGSLAGGSPQPLWPGGASRRCARFTPRAQPGIAGGAITIDCLYLAEDELTPFLEITGVLRPPNSPIKLVFAPHVMMTVSGTLTDIVDLTSLATQSALGTSHMELTGQWHVQQSSYLAGTGPQPPTQLLGEEAFGDGSIVGLRYPSSKHPNGVGLVVFTARLRPGRHAMRVFNLAAGKLQQSLP
jgi:hypothetical protein